MNPSQGPSIRTRGHDSRQCSTSYYIEPSRRAHTRRERHQGWRCNSARHPELLSKGPTIVTDRPDIEADVRYRRADMSTLFAYTARWQLAKNLSRGEPGLRLGEAALLVCAEDDAIASHSTVPFPVDAFLARIDKMVEEVEKQRLAPLRSQSASSSSGGGPSAADVVREVEAYLYETQRISVPPYGRSNLPSRGMVDHPGVWEDARWAYLNEALVRRRAHPAAAAILYAEVMRRLLARGVIDFAVAMDTRDFTSLPRAVILPGITRDMLLSSREGPAAAAAAAASSLGDAVSADIVLNTCTSETLAELLRHLKRSYWPFPWDCAVDDHASGGKGSHGGFRPAAKVAIGAEMGAALEAISTVANWRLERGIWTSPGAGDMRRCRAACERLVMLRGDADPDERRDLAVILMHSGEFGAARAELRAFMESAHFRTTADPFDKALCFKMMEALQKVQDQEPTSVMSVSSFLAGPPPSEVQLDDRKLPLTW